MQAIVFEFELKLICIIYTILISVIGSNSASAHSNASVSAGQQSVKGYAGKEVLVNGENGNSESNENGKTSSSHEEELNLHEWYKTYFHLD